MKNKRIRYSFVDEVEVLERLNDNLDLFNRMIIKFKETYTKSDEEIAMLIIQENYDDARIIVHSIKGVARNLGIFKLALVAEKLEKLLLDRAKNELLMSCLVEFNNTLVEVLNEINKFEKDTVKEGEE
ncbi:MAG: Hpt domain-containing protein [Negativicutes bacterium]|jgi:two-component system sensor histidine kinase/response regulator|nr:Hpt domain-containing protein [Negativicutes bacterium]MBP8628777.1 Hpt domain-containing protein [Negativicutes bacterium]MBP9537104.1 Hpt domain-containing protein [Negativicutes bacterium]MBP9948805.1 Hpt domain-containing protein [Negativicutes bacterium]